MKSDYLSIVLCLLAVVSCNDAEASLADCIDATCRVKAPDGSMGSGCVFEIGRGTVFVLTNRHVVGQAGSVQCVFWQQGHQSAAIAGQVLVRSDQVDVAVVTVPQSAFEGRLPRVIPIASRETRLAEGETVTSVGCAKGAWATSFKGHVLGYDGTSLCFTPPPADGRSGSALFDVGGRKIVGLIWGRMERGQGRGYAVTVDNLYRALNFKQTRSGWEHSPLRVLSYTGQTQCGPEGCFQLLPYRRYQQQRENERDRQFDRIDQRLELRGQVWPTLPPQVPPQVPSIRGSVDLGTEMKNQEATEKARDEATQRVSGLGVGLTLGAALALGFFLFYAVGRQ